MGHSAWDREWDKAIAAWATVENPTIGGSQQPGLALLQARQDA